ncbi:MAG: SRPBCC family protein [Vicinamibacterales bacterium]|nr:SRPBCC family protein [Vicinamibacterales bacterium]
MTSADLPYRLDRTLTIRAPRTTVFAFFTDSARWAAWWGAGSTIDPRPGGRVYIRHPNGIEAGGEVLEIDAPARLVFSYGFASGTPMPMGASLVTLTCEPHARGTRVRLVHEFGDEAARDEHVQGWRYQLSLFANVVADDLHRDVATRIDAWHAAWAEPDTAVRERMLASVATPDVRFRDRFSAIEGLSELLPHIAATQRFMPGLALARDGEIRHCQGMVLADWIATSADGQPRGRGSNVFILDADGLIESVTGLWR